MARTGKATKYEKKTFYYHYDQVRFRGMTPADDVFVSSKCCELQSEFPSQKHINILHEGHNAHSCLSGLILWFLYIGGQIMHVTLLFVSSYMRCFSIVLHIKIPGCKHML